MIVSFSSTMEMIYLNRPIMRHALYSAGVMPELRLPGRSVCVLQTNSSSMNNPNIFFTDEHIEEDNTRPLALSLQLPVVNTDLTGCSSSREPRNTSNFKGAALHLVYGRSLESVYVDFGVEERGRLRQRVDHTKPRKGKPEIIYRAIVGRRKRVTDPYVWDFTAGLGRDAFVLASAGCRVVMLERDPIVAALLNDGLRRLKESEDGVKGLKIDDNGVRLSSRLSLHCVDSSDVEYLRRIANIEGGWPEVAYLDPMFIANGVGPRKAAKAKLPLQMLQRLLDGDNLKEDVIKKGRMLWEVAASTSLLNIVVKRSPHGNPIVTTPYPSHTIQGKAVRFDVYNVEKYST